MIKIFMAAEEHIPSVLEIERAAIAPPWTHGSLLSEIYREDSLFAVAVESPAATVLGFVILRKVADEGELLQIAVDEAARRGGVADLLMGDMLRYAKSSGLKAIFLEVRKSNEAAIALYKKHGFEFVRFRRGYYSDPVEDAAVMSVLI